MVLTVLLDVHSLYTEMKTIKAKASSYLLSLKIILIGYFIIGGYEDSSTTGKSIRFEFGNNVTGSDPYH